MPTGWVLDVDATIFHRFLTRLKSVVDDGLTGLIRINVL